MKIYEIPMNLQIAIENMVDPETGECITQEQLDKLRHELTGTFNEGMEYLSKAVINESAELKMLQEHKASIDKRIKAKQKRIDSLKSYIGFCLKGEKFKSEDGLISIYHTKTSDVVKIDSIAEIPDEYFKAPHNEQNLMKTAIKEAIQEGKHVKGVHLEDTSSVVIRG